MININEENKKTGIIITSCAVQFRVHLLLNKKNKDITRRSKKK